MAEAGVNGVDDDFGAGEVCEGLHVEDVNGYRDRSFASANRSVYDKRCRHTLGFRIPHVRNKQRFLLETLQRVLSPGLHPRKNPINPVVHLGRDDSEMRFEVGRGGQRVETGGLFEFGEEKDGEEGVGDVVDLRTGGADLSV